MDTRKKLGAIAGAILITSLSACGGGGGSSGGKEEPTPQLTPLPVFLQGAESKCEFQADGKPVSLVGYTGDLNQVTALNCANVTFTDLNEIGSLPALKQLRIEHSNVKNLSALLNNSNLTLLDLSNSLGIDLDVIATLLGLTELDLANTGLADISQLHELIALQKLDLYGNNIVDVTALGNLLALLELDLGSNKITDTTPLGSLTNLNKLDLSGNEGLTCTDVAILDSTLAGKANIDVPSACISNITLNEGSEVERSIDNSQLAEPLQRVVITGVTGLDDIAIFHSGDDLRIEADTAAGVKVLVLTGWYLGEQYKVSEFEIQNVGLRSFNELRDSIGVGVRLTEGKDTYSGTNFNDIIYGLGENDIIAGGHSSDTIIGGKGDDILAEFLLNIAADGSVSRNNNYDGAVDTFIYNPGDGNDTLYLREGSPDKRAQLRFTGDIQENDITLYRIGNDLKLAFNENNSVTVDSWFASDTNTLGTIQFGNAEPVDAISWVLKQPLTLEAAGTLTGTNGSDYLLGTDGNDIIVGLGNADTIEGGKGDDILAEFLLNIAADGSVSRNNNSDGAVDTFIYNPGDGNDTLYIYELSLANRAQLQFTGDITEADIKAEQIGSDLVISIADSGSITITQWFTSDNYKLGTIKFGDAAIQSATEFVNSLLNQ